MGYWGGALMRGVMVCTLKSIGPPHLTNMNKTTYRVELDPQNICMEFLICTLICNNERPLKTLKVNFKR